MPLIVLEGLDGAGKSTQTRLLEQMLREAGKECEYVHFPRFDTPVYGELIARFLRGEFGQADAVNPRLVALLFAGDRADAAAELRRWLDEGRFVILDRYVASNIAYQCAKVADDEREALRDWILDMEYGHFGIPRPDVSLFLDVPFAFAQSNLAAARTGEDRDYLKGARDIHEESFALQRRVREMYLWAASLDDSLRIIDCSDGRGHMAAPQETFARIKAAAQTVIATAESHAVRK